MRADVRRPAPAAERHVVAMQSTAAVAHKSAARRDRVEFAERINAVLKRSPRARIGAVGLRIGFGVHLEAPHGE
jgi:hypothetical protein